MALSPCTWLLSPSIPHMQESWCPTDFRYRVCSAFWALRLPGKLHIEISNNLTRLRRKWDNYRKLLSLAQDQCIAGSPCQTTDSCQAKMKNQLKTRKVVVKINSQEIHFTKLRQAANVLTTLLTPSPRFLFWSSCATITS